MYHILSKKIARFTPFPRHFAPSTFRGMIEVQDVGSGLTWSLGALPKHKEYNARYYR